MMQTKLMINGIAVAVAIGTMALVGCGESGGSSGGAADASDEHGTDTKLSTGGMSNADHGDSDGHDDHDDHGDHGADAAPASLALDDSSAEGAINTYMNRLKAGDFIGAAEICVDGAPGTDALLRMGNTIETMMADPDQASLGETTKALFVGDLKTVEAVKTIEEDGVVVYEVKVINKPAVNIRVEDRDGAWRVIPPPDGMPMG